MGNLYNVEQHSEPQTVATGQNASKIGLDQWTTEMRKQVMEKLRGYAPEKVDEIIKATFGDIMDSKDI
jgi:hypothetical protein